MCGRATFAIEVSRTSMKAASATVAAISQGLALGFHCSLLPASAAIHFLHLWTESRSFSIMAAIRLNRLSIVVSIGSVGVPYKRHTVSESVLYVKRELKGKDGDAWHRERAIVGNQTRISRSRWRS